MEMISFIIGFLSALGVLGTIVIAGLWYAKRKVINKFTEARAMAENLVKNMFSTEDDENDKLIVDTEDYKLEDLEDDK